MKTQFTIDNIYAATRVGITYNNIVTSRNIKTVYDDK